MKKDTPVVVSEKALRAEERGSSLSGDRPRVCQSTVRGPRRNEGSPRWPTGSVYTRAPASPQHQRLSINHSRSAPLSLSRLLARLFARSLANSLQKCDRTANTGLSLRLRGSFRDYDHILRLVAVVREGLRYRGLYTSSMWRTTNSDNIH